MQFLEPRGAAGDRSQGQQQYGGQPSYGGEQSYGQAPQQNNYQQQPSYQQNQSPSQQNYTRVDEDPFANNNGGPIEVSEDDLPF